VVDTLDRTSVRQGHAKSAQPIPLIFWWICALVVAVAPMAVGAPSDSFTSTLAIPNRSNLEREIRQLISDEYSHWNLQDIEGYMIYFWRSPLFSWEVDGEFTIGWEACREQLYQEYPNSSTMGKVSDDRIQINLVAPDLATVIDWWTFNVHGKKISGFSVSTVKKFPEGWRVMTTQTSTSVNSTFER
jgi:hypothetical protein